MQATARAIKVLLSLCIIVVICSVWPATPAAYADSNCEPDGVQGSGAVYRICMPAEGEWNGDLVVYAHGYVAFNEPIGIPEDQLSLPGDVSLPELANELGFAFATTSYSVNGLAVRQGLDDLLDLVNVFTSTHGQPDHVYLVGASEGGIIAALAIEHHSDVFDGGLAACGPVGNFRWQINYWGDIRVLFDYFFPSVIPGSPVDIPQEVIDSWDTIYKQSVEAALRSRPSRLRQLLDVARISTHPIDNEKNIQALVDLLWYNVFATNDGIAKLGGQPFDNSQRYYHGSRNDGLLNKVVARFQAEPAAINEIDSHYQTSGDLGSPLVTLHTLGDEIIPYWHQPIYRYKVVTTGNETLHTDIPVLLRYGHCNFSTPQVLMAFVLLVREVMGNTLLDADRVLPTAQERDEYRDLAASYELLPDMNYRIFMPIIPR